MMICLSAIPRHEEEAEFARLLLKVVLIFHHNKYVNLTERCRLPLKFS